MATLQEPDAGVDALARSVIGAAIEVHRHRGPGFLESVHQEALCVELRLRRIPLERPRPANVEYRCAAWARGGSA